MEIVMDVMVFLIIMGGLVMGLLSVLYVIVLSFLIYDHWSRDRVARVRTNRWFGENPH